MASRKSFIFFGGEDSLDSIEFFLDVEKRLGLGLSDRDTERIIPPFSGERTVGDLVRNVCDVVGRPAAAQPAHAPDRAGG